MFGVCSYRREEGEARETRLVGRSNPSAPALHLHSGWVLRQQQLMVVVLLACGLYSSRRWALDIRTGGNLGLSVTDFRQFRVPPSE